MEGYKNTNSIRKDFITGVVWGIVERFSTLFVGFFVTILLARKLMPEDYGLINMLAIFTTLALVILDGGFGQALIQKKDPTQQDYSSVFYFNLLFSTILYLVLYLLTPYIALFYRQERLIDIAHVAFLLIPINSLSIIQHTILTKYLKVKNLAVVSVCASTISGVVGITAAYFGIGVWALVLQTLTYYSVRCLVLWFINDWRPTLTFSFYSIKSIWRFSLSLLGVHMLAAIFQNIYTVIIGRYYNVNDVGYYNQALRMESLANDSVNQVVQRVVFPAFAQIQNDDQRLKLAYSKVINMMMFINLPIMLGLIIPAESIFSIILSDKWLPAVPYFQLLCLTGVLYPLHIINTIVLKAKGMGKKYFFLETFKRCVMILFIILTINKGVSYLLIGFVCSTCISAILSMYYCGKVMKFSMLEQIKEILPIIASTGVMLMSMYGVKQLEFSHSINLILQIITATSIYVVISILLKVKSFIELKAIVISKIKC